MELEELVIFIIICGLLVLGVNYADNEQKKEFEILKKNKEYTVHKKCIEFDEDWYCYD